jgi:hypothetical protein
MAVRRSISGKLAPHLGRRVFISPCLAAPPAALRIKDGASTGTATITQTSRHGQPVPPKERFAAPSDKKLRPPTSDKKLRPPPSDKKLRPPPSDKPRFSSRSCSADSPRTKPGRSERRRHATAAGDGDQPAKVDGKRVAERGGAERVGVRKVRG